MNAPPAIRMLGLLAASGAASSTEAAALLSIGDRDRRLFALREATFGASLVSVSPCPACHERLEWSTECGALAAQTEDGCAADLSLESGEYAVRFRLPNTVDLAAAGRANGVEAARRVLLERCVLDASHEDVAVAAADLPAEVTDAISRQMSDADRGAGTEVVLDCPACSHRWTLLFDIETFFWSELTAWVPRVLKEVHTLARAYGWHEADILRLSPRRREFYLAVVRA